MTKVGDRLIEIFGYIANILCCLVIYLDPDTKRSYTYAQVRSTAIEFGKGLKAVWGWKKNDVLALYTPNCIDTPAVTWGCHWAGGILSPANPGYTVDELAFQLKDSGAKALITQKPFLQSAMAACKKVGIDEDRIILMGDERDETHKFKHFSGIRNLAGTSRYKKTKVDPKKDLAFLVYSSGTVSTSFLHYLNRTRDSATCLEVYRCFYICGAAINTCSRVFAVGCIC